MSMSFFSKCLTTLKFTGIYTILNKDTGQRDKPSLSSNPLRCFLPVLKIRDLYFLSYGPYKEFWSDMELEARACICRTHTFKEGDEGGFWGCSFYGSTPIQVKHGVPQSSTTTVPLFFMFPINDLNVF